VAEQTRPSAIVATPLAIENQLVSESTVAELLTVAIARLGYQRVVTLGLAEVGVEVAGEIARECALAITHIEDGITRANKAHYRTTGIFAITDAERKS
jgi:hypothetical protein